MSILNKILTTVFCLGVLASTNLAAKVSKGGNLAKPSIDRSSVFMTNDVEVNEKAEQLRKQAQQSMLDILNNRKNLMPERKYELKLRIGEIFLERYEYSTLLEAKRNDLVFKKWEKTDQKTPPPKLNSAKATSLLDRGIFVLKNLVDSYPNHKRTDAALFALGKSLIKKNDEQGVKYFNKLIKNFPKSKYVTDANISSGEYYFEHYKMDQARPYYFSAVKNTKHENYTYALYKLAWTIYNKESTSPMDKRKDLKQALGIFQKVVTLSKSQDSRRSLENEALDDMVIVFADLGNDEAAWQYFKKEGDKEKYYTFLERLGYLHSENGKYAQSVQVYNKIIKMDPTRKSIPKIYEKLVVLYESLNKPALIYDSLSKLMALTDSKNPWNVANAKETDKIKDIASVVEEQSMKFGTVYHRQSQNNRSNQTRKLAARFYNFYANHFPKSKNIYEVKYYLAEINFDLEEYITATKHFFFVAKSAPKASKFKKLAADGMVDAAKTEVAGKTYKELPKLGSVKNPIVIPQEKKLLISTLDLYSKIYPHDKKVAGYSYAAADIMFGYGHYKNSVARFGRVIDIAPSSEFAMYSAQKTLGFFVEKKQWQNAVETSMQYLKNKKLLKPKLNTFVVSVLKTSSFKLGEFFESKKQYAKAGEQYEKYVRLFPKDKDSNKAYNNSIANYYKAKKIDKALLMSEAFIAASPKSPLVVTISGVLASNYEKIGSFDKAAKAYEKHYQLTRGNNISSKIRMSGNESLYSAGILYKGLKNFDRAEVVFDQYMSISNNPTKNSNISMLMAASYESSQQIGKAQEKYKKVVHAPQGDKANKIYAQAKIYDFHVKAGIPGASESMEKLAKQLVTIKDVDTTKAREICADYSFQKAQPLQSKYNAVKVNSYKDLEVQAATKQGLLTKLSVQYESLVKLGIPEIAVASQYKMGQSLEAFANELMRVMPKDKQTQENDAQFIAEIKSISNNLAQQANGFYAQSFSGVKNIKKSSPWVRIVQTKQNALIAKASNGKKKAVAANSKGARDQSTQLMIKPVYMGLDFKNKKIIESLAH